MLEWPTISQVPFRKYAFLVDQALVSGGSFLTIAICAHLLSTGDQGRLGYLLAAYMGSIILNTTAIFQTASTVAPLQEDKPTFYSQLACSQLLLAIAFTAIAILVATVTNAGLYASAAGYALFAGFLLTQQLTDCDRRLSYIFSSGFRAMQSSMWVYPVRIVLLVLLRPKDLTSVTLVLWLSALVPAGLLVVRHIIPGFRLRSACLDLVSLLKESKWLLLSAPVIWLWSFLPVFAAGSVLNLATVGVFTTIRSLANIGNVLMELLETEVSAKMGRLFAGQAEQFKSSVTKTRLMGMLVWLSGAVFILLFGGFALHLLFGDRYAAYAPLLLVLWTANGASFLYRLNAVVLRTTGSSRAVMSGYVTGLLVMVVASRTLLINFGINGAGYIALVGAVSILLGQRLLGRPAAMSTST